MSKQTVQYVVKKGNKYLDSYQKGKAKWCWVVWEASMMSWYMASRFAELTKGHVVKVVMTEENVKRCDINE